MIKLSILLLFTLLVGCGGGSDAGTEGAGSGSDGASSSDGSGSNGSSSDSDSGSGSDGSTSGSDSGSSSGGSSSDSGSGSNSGGSTAGSSGGSGSTPSSGGPSCSATGDLLGSDGGFSILYPFCVRSGRVTYGVSSTITSSVDGGTMLMETTGEDILTFTDWGNIRKDESTSHTNATITTADGTKNFSFDNHTMTKIINKSLYGVSFEKEEINKIDFTDFVPGLNYFSNYILDDGQGTVYEDAGFSIVNGHVCNKKDIVLSNVLGLNGETSTASSCAEKGVDLETVLDILRTDSEGTSHMVTTRTATDIEFDLPLNSADLALPDFPVINGAQLTNDNPNAVAVLYAIDISAVPVQCSNGSGTLIVKNDVINGTVSLNNDSQVFEVSGEIGPDKKIYGGFVRGNTRVADYEGVATDTGLSGTWQDFGGCYGTWETR